MYIQRQKQGKTKEKLNFTFINKKKNQQKTRKSETQCKNIGKQDRKKETGKREGRQSVKVAKKKRQKD